MKICIVDNCESKSKCRYYCGTHYTRFYRHGSPYVTLQEQHGKWKSPEYEAWNSMRKRCLNPNQRTYGYYGGRGIKIYEEWVKSFTAFYSYVGDKPTSKHSLDRINNDGNYEPGNVRWATVSQQNSNKRKPLIYRLPTRDNATGRFIKNVAV